jgi:hypothetical protein
MRKVQKAPKTGTAIAPISSASAKRQSGGREQSQEEGRDTAHSTKEQSCEDGMGSEPRVGTIRIHMRSISWMRR